jgi:hypothetical protein
MKNLKSLMIVASVLLISSLKAQIPNPDFEQWKATSVSKPTGWRTYGHSQKVSGFKSLSAVRLQRSTLLNDGPGAVIYGDPENGFTGGIPVSGRPDSAIGFFKYSIVTGDTGWYLVFLKRKGVPISQDIFYLLGGDSTKFTRLAFKINYNDTGKADSLVIGVAASNPDGNKQGSFVTADSLHLTGGTGVINVPNGNFESWQTISYDEPLGWFTTNPRIPPGVSFPVTRSTDRASSVYSVRIENVDIGGGKFSEGYIMAGRQGNQGPKAGFPVTGRDSFLFCNYKCFPKGGDTINIAIMMYRKDTMIGMGSLRQWVDVNTWTGVAIPIGYWGPGKPIPDSAAIFCAAFQGGQSARGNSVLFVDGLKLNSPMNDVQHKWILPAIAYPNPAKNFVIINLGQIQDNCPRISIFDASGRVMEAPHEFVQGSRSVKVNTSNIPPGIWYFELKSNIGVYKGGFTIHP